MIALIALAEDDLGGIQVLGSGTENDRQRLADLLEESPQLRNRRVVLEGPRAAWCHDVPADKPKRGRQPKPPAPAETLDA